MDMFCYQLLDQGFQNFIEHIRLDNVDFLNQRKDDNVDFPTHIQMSLHKNQEEKK